MHQHFAQFTNLGVDAEFGLSFCVLHVVFHDSQIEWVDGDAADQQKSKMKWKILRWVELVKFASVFGYFTLIGTRNLAQKSKGRSSQGLLA